MAIVHPREMPHIPKVESTFTLDEGTVVSRHDEGRRGTVSQIRDPIWSAHLQTQPLDLGGRAEWQAWKNTLRGGLRSFLAWDVSRYEPRAYPNGVPEIIAGTWNGQGTVTSLATPGQIAASGTPAGFELMTGDRVGLIENGRYGYFDVSADATADGTGAITVEVEPLVSSLFTTAAVIVFRRPRLLMQMINGSFSAPGTAGLVPVSFDAVQVL